jgi:hypothetical protein
MPRPHAQVNNDLRVQAHLVMREDDAGSRDREKIHTSVLSEKGIRTSQSYDRYVVRMRSSQVGEGAP